LKAFLIYIFHYLTAAFIVQDVPGRDEE